MTNTESGMLWDSVMSVLTPSSRESAKGGPRSAGKSWKPS